MIKSFQGKYYFLSNFYPCIITRDGFTFKSVEAAYQASKTECEELRIQIANATTPGEAKKLGRKVKIRPDWEYIKDSVMLSLLRQKFNNNPDLRKRLLATGNQILEEGITWGDIYWGVCEGIGENRLGKLLMQVREEIINAST